MNIALLFVLLRTAEFVVSANKCGLDDYQYRLFTKVHRNMNLTLDCKAVENAIWFSQTVLNGQGENINTQFWCKYIKKTSSRSGVGAEGTWIQDKLLKEVKWDQVAQTALLHPKTKYGCYARRGYRNQFWHEVEEYVLVCIYQKLAPQKWCNIDWSY